MLHIGDNSDTLVDVIRVDHLRAMLKKANAGGETLRSLGKRCGLHHSQISRFIDGQDIGGESCEKIASAFGLMPKNAEDHRTLLMLAKLMAESKIDPADLRDFIEEKSRK